MQASSSHFEALVRFNNKNFIFDNDCVGAEVSFIFKSQKFVICFPNFNFADLDVFGHPKPTLKGTRIDLDWSSKLDEDIVGRATGWNPKTKVVSKFGCNELIIRSRSTMTPAEARTAKKNLPEWREFFAKWFEAIEYQDLESSDTIVEQEEQLQAYIVPALKSKPPRRIKTMGEGSASITAIMRNGTTRSHLKKILKRSSSGAFPPGYFAQLISALKYINRKEYRQSVLNSATAFEMGLIQLLDSRLTTSTSAQKKLIADKYQQIVGLSIALRTLGEALPPQKDIQAKIAEPRNAAIHRGVEVTQNQAKDALDFVKSFIYSKFSL